MPFDVSRCRSLAIDIISISISIGIIHRSPILTRTIAFMPGVVGTTGASAVVGADGGVRGVPCYRVFTGGEPTNSLAFESFDLNLVSGGSNLAVNAFFLPLLMHEKSWTLQDPQRLGLEEPLAKRPIDFLYRSSNCLPRREALAAAVRKAFERAGLVFEASGGCKGRTPIPQGQHPKGIQGNGDWGDCPECRRSKLIAAFENFADGEQYLSEKALLAAEYGALTAYHGNGQPLMDEIGMDASRHIDRAAYASDAAFADALVRLAQSPDELEGRRALPVFRDLSWQLGRMNLTRVREHTCRDAKLRVLRGRERAATALLLSDVPHHGSGWPRHCAWRASVCTSCTRITLP